MIPNILSFSLSNTINEQKSLRHQYVFLTNKGVIRGKITVNFRQYKSIKALLFIGITATGTGPLGGYHCHAIGIAFFVSVY